MESNRNTQTHSMLEYLYAVLSLVTFGVGAYILTRFGWQIAIVYLGYCLLFEAYIFYKSYGATHTYGKTYRLGASYYFGKNSAFEKHTQVQKQKEYAQRSKTKVSMLNLFPEILIVIPPIIAAIHRYYFGFSWVCGGLLAVFFLVYFLSKGIIWTLPVRSSPV